MIISPFKTFTMINMIYLYILLVIVLHVIPTGEKSLDTTVAGPLRADYLLHSLVFLPWMFLAGMWKRNTTGSAVGKQETADSGRFTIAPFSRLLLASYSLRFFLVWMGMGIALAIGAEAIQYWLPQRTYNPWDAVFNALGVVIGAVLVAGINLRKFRN